MVATESGNLSSIWFGIATKINRYKGGGSQLKITRYAARRACVAGINVVSKV